MSYGMYFDALQMCLLFIIHAEMFINMKYII